MSLSTPQELEDMPQSIDAATESAPPPEDPSIAGYAASDRATSTDTLGFKPYVEAIASFLTAPDTEPPITISIEGEWGSGKSSFLLQLEAAIKEISKTAKPDPQTNLPPQPSPFTLRFNAWRHDKQDQLWAAFALAFVESLRKEIGWRRAFLGDIKLFCRRLQGFKAWAELFLLSISLFVVVIVIWRYHTYLTPAHIRAALASLTADPKDSHLDRDLFSRLAEHGFWASLASLAIAGFYRFHASFKLPLSISLKKYLAKPDYEGHTAFIETFHKDLQRLVECYASRSRVFVFIDDLDRCDVPKAAELMQAINLMIGESPNLVFILGMDREKVAAGIALKYKDLFPFLRESALWKPNVDKNDFTPLYFGYGYLEKFIQLSFTLPTPNTDVALNQFLTPRPLAYRVADRITAERSQGFLARLGFRPRDFRVEQTFDSVGSTGRGRSSLSIDGRVVAQLEDVQAPPDFDLEPVPSNDPPRVAYHRVNVVEDDDRTRAIVRMTAPLFEYNPRRIKQFTNTFRLALFLFSDLGLFDALQPDSDSKKQEEPQAPPTAEQVGKIIALLLRFPDLRFALDQNPNILADLEAEATRRKHPTSSKFVSVPPSEAVLRWLDQPGAAEVVAYNVDPASYVLYPMRPSYESHRRHSLIGFPVGRLFTILPRAARPPKAGSSSPDEVLASEPPQVTTASTAPTHQDQAVSSRVSEPSQNLYPAEEFQPAKPSFEPPIISHDLNLSIEELEISVRSYNCLRQAKILTVGELIQKTEAEILKMKNFRRTNLSEIKQVLAYMGLALGMKIDEQGNPVPGPTSVLPGQTLATSNRGFDDSAFDDDAKNDDDSNEIVIEPESF